MRQVCFFTISICLAVIVQNSVSAADPDVGFVSNSKGSAIISRASVGGLTVKDDVGVKMDDVIETGKGSLSVLFKDETLVDISQHSMLLIDDFVYDPTTSTGALAIKATLGTLRYMSGEIANNAAENINISTPTASVAVRGTEFTATVDEIGRSTFVLLPSCDFTGLNCVVGAIEVSTDAGTVFMNQANQMTQVDSASLAPTLPVILDQSYTQIGANFILGGASVSRKVAGIKQAEANEASEGANVFIDQLDVDLLDNESLLDEGARAYVNHPRGARFEGTRLHLSSIFDWYRTDFPEGRSGLYGWLADHAAPALADRLRAYDGSFRDDYDWALNAAP